jgi:hypothetical protein
MLLAGEWAPEAAFSKADRLESYLLNLETGSNCIHFHGNLGG